jgi:hypothetical protein
MLAQIELETTIDVAVSQADKDTTGPLQVAHNIRVLSHLSDNRITYETDSSLTPSEALSSALTNAESLIGISQTPLYKLARDDVADAIVIVGTSTEQAKANADTLKLAEKNAVAQRTLIRLNNYEAIKAATALPTANNAANYAARIAATAAADDNLIASNLAVANARTAAFAAAAIVYTEGYRTAQHARIAAQAAGLSIHLADSVDMADTGDKNCVEDATAFHKYAHVATAEAAVAAEKVEAAAESAATKVEGDI